jgi:hypothetical protein
MPWELPWPAQKSMPLRVCQGGYCGGPAEFRLVSSVEAALARVLVIRVHRLVSRVQACGLKCRAALRSVRHVEITWIRGVDVECGLRLGLDDQLHLPPLQG